MFCLYSVLSYVAMSYVINIIMFHYRYSCAVDSAIVSYLKWIYYIVMVIIMVYRPTTWTSTHICFRKHKRLNILYMKMISLIFSQQIQWGTMGRTPEMDSFSRETRRLVLREPSSTQAINSSDHVIQSVIWTCKSHSTLLKSSAPTHTNREDPARNIHWGLFCGPIQSDQQCILGSAPQSRVDNKQTWVIKPRLPARLD